MSNAWVFFLDQPVEVFAGKMFFGAEEDIQNQIALGGALEPLPLEVFEEYFFFFSHRLGKPLTTFLGLLFEVILHVSGISVKTLGRTGITTCRDPLGYLT